MQMIKKYGSSEPIEPIMKIVQEQPVAVGVLINLAQAFLEAHLRECTFNLKGIVITMCALSRIGEHEIARRLFSEIVLGGELWKLSELGDEQWAQLFVSGVSSSIPEACELALEHLKAVFLEPNPSNESVKLYIRLAEYAHREGNVEALLQLYQISVESGRNPGSKGRSIGIPTRIMEEFLGSMTVNWSLKQVSFAGELLEGPYRDRLFESLFEADCDDSRMLGYLDIFSTLIGRGKMFNGTTKFLAVTRAMFHQWMEVVVVIMCNCAIQGDVKSAGMVKDMLRDLLKVFVWFGNEEVVRVAIGLCESYPVKDRIALYSLCFRDSLPVENEKVDVTGLYAACCHMHDNNYILPGLGDSFKILVSHAFNKGFLDIAVDAFVRMLNLRFIPSSGLTIELLKTIENSVENDRNVLLNCMFDMFLLRRVPLSEVCLIKFLELFVSFTNVDNARKCFQLLVGQDETNFCVYLDRILRMHSSLGHDEELLTLSEKLLDAATHAGSFHCLATAADVLHEHGLHSALEKCCLVTAHFLEKGGSVPNREDLLSLVELMESPYSWPEQLVQQVLSNVLNSYWDPEILKACARMVDRNGFSFLLRDFNGDALVKRELLEKIERCSGERNCPADEHATETDLYYHSDISGDDSDFSGEVLRDFPAIVVAEALSLMDRDTL